MRRSFSLVFTVVFALTMAFTGIVQAATYKEASMLAEMVKAGKLPPGGEEAPLQTFCRRQVSGYRQVWRDLARCVAR